MSSLTKDFLSFLLPVDLLLHFLCVWFFFFNLVTYFCPIRGKDLGVSLFTRPL